MVDKRILDFLLSENWKIKVFDIMNQWDDLIDNKSAYTDNEDTVDLEAFAVLAEDTYDIIEELRYACVNINEETAAEYKGQTSGTRSDFFVTAKSHLLHHHTEIIAAVRAYSVLECYSDNTEYKATVAVARALYQRLISMYSAGLRTVLAMNLGDGAFWLSREYSEAELARDYFYDIRNHDFSEMLDFAEEIN